MMQDVLGYCKDFCFYSERNEELLKSYPKRNERKATEWF